MVWLSLFDLVTGKYSVKDVSGPVGVVDYVSDAAQVSVKTADYTGLLSIMALITIKEQNTENINEKIDWNNIFNNSNSNYCIYS